MKTETPSVEEQLRLKDEAITKLKQKVKNLRAEITVLRESRKS